MKRKLNTCFILACMLFIVLNFNLRAQPGTADSLLLQIKKEKLHDTMLAKYYNLIATSFVPNAPDSIIKYAKLGAKHSASYKQINSNLINTVGVGYYYKGDYDSAAIYYLDALKIRETLGNEKLISSSYNNLAVIYQVQGETKKAMEYYFRILKVREKQNDLVRTANVCDNIANLYNDINEPRTALIYQVRTLKLVDQLKDSLGIAQIYLNIASTYTSLKKEDSAYYYINQSIPILLKYNQLANLAQAYNAMAIQLSHKNIPLSINYFIKSKNTFEEQGDIANAAGILINIGNAKIKLKDFVGALKDCREALPIIEKANYLDKTKHCYFCLYQSYKELNNPGKSLEYYEKFVRAKDSMENKARTKELTRIEVTYEYNKKAEIAEIEHQKEIALQESEKKKQKLVIYFVVFSLLVAVFLIFFVINRLKITRKQNVIIEQQKQAVEKQKAIVDEHQKEILDSIHYAKRIQNTLLAHESFLNENISQNFVLFNPKDIVSGDFYWAARKEDLFFLAVCDSTGHGVPGAFMSLLNIGFLSEAINEKNILRPNEIFNYVRERLVNSISKEGQKDGFDGILICMDQKNQKITYAAANNNPVIVSNNNIAHLPVDKMPVGKGERTAGFELYSIDYQEGDHIYLYTDGYPDQFGGPKGKKFKYKQLEDLLIVNSNLPLEKQKENLSLTFGQWKGNLEQVDDVLLIGIKI